MDKGDEPSVWFLIDISSGDAIYLGYLVHKFSALRWHMWQDLDFLIGRYESEYSFEVARQSIIS